MLKVLMHSEDTAVIDSAPGHGKGFMIIIVILVLLELLDDDIYICIMHPTPYLCKQAFATYGHWSNLFKEVKEPFKTFDDDKKVYFLDPENVG